MRTVNRRQFATEAGLAFLSGVTITITACGGGSDTGSTPTTTPPAGNPPSGTSDEVGTVSDNHGHTAVITAAQLDAGTALTGLTIAGNAGHPHTISLSAQALSEIKAGRPVDTVSTSNDGHTHIVTFNPSANEPPTRY
jgi:hypothetical protein